MLSEAHVTTGYAARYAGQLCAHFQHKLPAELTRDGPDKASGRIEFAVGTCTLEADGDRLVLRADSPDADRLAQLQAIIDRHLERFAFRDKPAIVWHAAG
jgi:hypothetical protein